VDFFGWEKKYSLASFALALALAACKSVFFVGGFLFH